MVFPNILNHRLESGLEEQLLGRLIQKLQALSEKSMYDTSKSLLESDLMPFEVLGLSSYFIRVLADKKLTATTMLMSRKSLLTQLSCAGTSTRSVSSIDRWIFMVDCMYKTSLDQCHIVNGSF
mmetsp:Transcript_6709/g.9319  ORF Transcript_6709/g.9319 Transcript_6709/m.9319 type:complete len:123 (+) Transcript_6709:357-725(+)